MTLPSIKIGLTCVGGALAPALMGALRNSKNFNYRIVGLNASPTPHGSAFADEFHIVPLGTDTDYLPRVLEVVQQEGIDFLLVGSDEEALAVSECLETFHEYGCTPLVSSRACLERISDKRLTYERLRNSGVRAPAFTAVDTVSGLVNAVHAYGYPEKTVIVKPSRARGGRGLQVIIGRETPPEWLGAGLREARWNSLPNGDEVGRFFDHGAELLVMPCLGVPAYDADVVMFGAEPIVTVRRRCNPTGIPFEGNVIVSDESLIDYCRDVARAMELEAIHDIDLMTDENGDAVVLEVNPRPSGSMVASIVAGFPVVDWAIARSINLDIPVEIPQGDVSVRSIVTPYVDIS